MTIVFDRAATHLVSEPEDMARKAGQRVERESQPQLISPAQGWLMRLILRLLGTWLIGLALVLLVVDGTKSLAANVVEFTSLSKLWMQVNAASLDAVRLFFESRFFADLLDTAFNALLTYPAFAVFAVPGIVLALAGRKPRRERFLRHDQI
jgi:hypothetical protein